MAADSKEARIHQVLNQRHNKRAHGGDAGEQKRAHASAKPGVGTPPPEDEAIKERITSLVGTLRALAAMVRDPHYTFPLQFKLLMILGALYVISPIDLIPELIFGPFGVVDDLGVIALMLRMIYTEANNYVRGGAED